jgi:hypothetical protein
MKRQSCIALILLAVIIAPTLGIGCGVKSPPIAPQLAVPEQITSLNAIAEKDGVRLAWDRPGHTAGGHKMSDLGSFEINRAQGSGEFLPLAEIPVTDQDRFQQQQRFSYLDNTAVVGRRYRYQVISATLDNYRSEPSNLAEISYEPPAPPPNPENYQLPQPTPLP